MIFKFANPLKFQRFAGRFQPVFLSLSFLFLIFGLFYSFFKSPPDYLQGETVRIMYIHVPCAWFSLMIYSIIAVCSLFSIVFKHALADIISRASAPIGASFTLATLVTGSIWGKPTWGTWWVWDARITSMLILALFYFMYLLAWRVYDDREKVFKITSIITILGLYDCRLLKI